MSSIRESFTQPAVGAGAIDRDGGVIKGVKLLGESGNCDYPRSTREKALPLFEGARVCISHAARGADRASTYGDGIGVVRNVRESGDGVYGDFHFNPEHPLANQICWDASNAPQHLGFSIAGDGDKRRVGGRTVVESLTGLSSIDLVSRPATTGGMFESKGKGTTMKKLSEIIEALKDSRPHYVRGLTSVREAMDGTESGAMSDPMMAEPPEAADEPADHEQALMDGFRAAWSAIFDDDGMEAGEKISKAKELLKAMDKLTGKGKGDDTPAEPAAAEEARKKKAGNLRESALLQLGRKGVKLTPLVETAIKGCESEAEVKTLVDSLGEADRRPGARSAAPAAATPVRESKTPAGKTPAERDAERAERLHRMRSTR